MKKPILFILLFCFFTSSKTTAQVSLKETSFKNQIDSSSLVVEGKVVSKKAFWGNDGLIYTANTVDIYKVFKGELVETIEVITVGGTVGSRALISSTSLKLRENDTGIFMLYDNNIQLKSKVKSSIKVFKPFGSLQGFYKYNLHNDVAINPFNKKQGISTSFYKEIMGYTKSKYTEVAIFHNYTNNLKSGQNAKSLALGITDFTPTIATAGTKEVLTINGSDFGTVQGKVGFSDADEGGNGNYVDALDSQVLSWNEMQITVEIPSGAGTGNIRVTHDDNNVVFSGSDLTISYAETNIESDPGTGMEAYQVQHFNTKGSGGYTWEMQTDFFNDNEPGNLGAKVAFERAFETWRCTTKINWIISGSATTTDVIGEVDLAEPFDGELDEDGINVIRFDNGSELENNVLGTCFSWYGTCNGTDWLIVAMDIVFDDATDWYFGADAVPNNFFDFESVALHELGHGHQLGHVINPNEVMHFSLTDGTSSRTLSTDDIAGAVGIQNRSTGTALCGQALMTNYAGTCDLGIDEVDLANAISIFPNPATSEFFIKNDAFINLKKAVIYDVSGRQISEYDLSETSRVKSINIQNFSKGVYIVSIYSDNASISKKLILD